MGPLAYAFADGDADAAKAAEEAAAAEAAKAAEEEAAKLAEADAAEAAKAEEDPLATPNPFEEGSSQHEAFEKQREKFRSKLAKETEAARREAESAVAGKLDQVLEALGTVKTKEPAEAVTPPAPGTKATKEDIEIVTDALRAIGFDPQQAAQDRRRNEVNAALAQLRTTYPGIEFNDLDLVKFANDSGISRMGGAAYDVLELAFIRRHKEAITAGVKAPAPAKVDPKKSAVPIKQNSTKKEPNPATDRPRNFADYKAKIMSKFRKAE